MNEKSGKKTLLMSVIMSSFGPVVIGLGLLVGKSSTQIADFIRRSVELIAIIIAFVIYCVTNKNGEVNLDKKIKLEKATNIIVGFAMIFSSIIMIALALFFESEEKGNVIPGLAIALLGVVANSIFWFKYLKLSIKTNNSILRVQSNLYRAKTFVDASVTIALLVMLISPNSAIAYYFDIIGTVCVAIYLGFTGLKTLIKSRD